MMDPSCSIIFSYHTICSHKIHHFLIIFSSFSDIHIIIIWYSWYPYMDHYYPYMIIIIWIIFSSIIFSHHFLIMEVTSIARTSLQRSPRWTLRGSRAASRGRSIRAIPRRPRWGSQKPSDKTGVSDGFWWFLMVFDGFLIVFDGFWRFFWCFWWIFDGFWWFLMVFDGFWGFLMDYFPWLWCFTWFFLVEFQDFNGCVVGFNLIQSSKKWDYHGFPMVFQWFLMVFPFFDEKTLRFPLLFDGFYHGVVWSAKIPTAKTPRRRRVCHLHGGPWSTTSWWNPNQLRPRRVRRCAMGYFDMYRSINRILWIKIYEIL